MNKVLLFLLFLVLGMSPLMAIVIDDFSDDNTDNPISLTDPGSVNTTNATNTGILNSGSRTTSLQLDDDGFSGATSLETLGASGVADLQSGSLHEFILSFDYSLGGANFIGPNNENNITIEFSFFQGTDVIVTVDVDGQTASKTHTHTGSGSLIFGFDEFSGGVLNPTSVSSMSVEFDSTTNSGAEPSADFVITEIRSAVPEPNTIVLAVLAAIFSLCAYRKKFMK